MCELCDLENCPSTVLEKPEDLRSETLLCVILLCGKQHGPERLVLGHKTRSFWVVETGSSATRYSLLPSALSVLAFAKPP